MVIYGLQSHSFTSQDTLRLLRKGKNAHSEESGLNKSFVERERMRQHGIAKAVGIWISGSCSPNHLAVALESNRYPLFFSSATLSIEDPSELLLLASLVLTA